MLSGREDWTVFNCFKIKVLCCLLYYLWVFDTTIQYLKNWSAMFLKFNCLDTAVFYKIQVSSAHISSRCQGNKTQDILLFIDIVADRHRNDMQKTRKTVSPDCMKLGKTGFLLELCSLTQSFHSIYEQIFIINTHDKWNICMVNVRMNSFFHSPSVSF